MVTVSTVTVLHGELVLLLSLSQESKFRYTGHGLVMKIGDFGMSRQIIMARNAAGEVGLERALSSNIIGTAAYCAPELLLAESPVKRNKASAATILKSDVSNIQAAAVAAAAVATCAAAAAAVATCDPAAAVCDAGAAIWKYVGQRLSLESCTGSKSCWCLHLGDVFGFKKRRLHERTQG